MTGFHFPLTLMTGFAAMAMLVFPLRADELIEPLQSNTVFEGTVVSIGRAAIVIRSMPNDEMMTFRVREDAKITLDGHQVTLYELFMGDHAHVTAETVKTHLVASTIEATSPL